MPTRGRELTVPSRLAIEMGVDIDEAWGDEEAGGIDNPLAREGT